MSSSLLAPAYSLNVGSQGWTEQLTEVDVHLLAAPLLDHLAASMPAAAPVTAAPGDPVSLSLDGGEGSHEVFTGLVSSVRRDGRTTTITAVDAGGALADLRPAATFEQATVGTVISELCADAGVDTGSIEVGPALPFYVADPGRTALEHVARLAAWAGALAAVDSKGRLEVNVVTGADADVALRYGREVLAARVDRGGCTRRDLRRRRRGHTGRVAAADARLLRRPPARRSVQDDRVGLGAGAAHARRGEHRFVVAHAPVPLGPQPRVAGGVDAASAATGHGARDPGSPRGTARRTVLDRPGLAQRVRAGRVHPGPPVERRRSVQSSRPAWPARRRGEGARVSTAHTIVSTIRGIAREEAASRWYPALAVVTSTHGGKTEHACTVRLRETGLVLPKVPIAIGLLGTAALPAVGDLVLVVFAGGDLHAPVVVGRLYDDEIAPPDHATGELVALLPADEDDETKALKVLVKTPGDGTRKLEVALKGSVDVSLLLDDETIALQTKDAKLELRQTGSSDGKATLAVAGSSITIEQGGDVAVKAAGTLKLEGNKVEIDGAASVKVAGQIIDLN